MIRARGCPGATLGWATLCWAALGWATPALADPLVINGAAVAWPADAWPIPIADADLSWRRAAAEWTRGAAGFAPVGPTAVRPDGVIALAEWGEARWAAEVGDAALIGFTLITHEGDRLTDADVVLNVDRYRFSSAPDLRSFHRPTTLAHELGHALGLDHVEAVEALMHPAQEPGEVGRIDADALEDLAEVSTCCVQIRRPTLEDATARRMRLGGVAPGDAARAHGATVIDLPIGADGALDLPQGARAVEVWTRAGQGGVFDVPDAAPDAGPDALSDAAPDARVADAAIMAGPAPDAGCRHGAGPGAPQLWILPAVLSLFGVWRRR